MLLAPQNFHIDAATDSSVTIEWDAVVGASTYDVLKMRANRNVVGGGDMGAFKLVDYTVSAPTTSLVLSVSGGDIPGIGYGCYYKVRGVEADGTVGNMSEVLKLQFAGADTLAPFDLPAAPDGMARAMLMGYDSASDKYRPVAIDPATGQLKVTTS